MFGNLSQIEEYTPQSMTPYTDLGRPPQFVLPTPPPLPILPLWQKMKSIWRNVVNDQEMDLKVQLLQAKTTSGRFIWPIPTLSRFIERAKAKEVTSIYSAPFYTSDFGYKLALRMYLHGDGAGRDTHISLFLVVMQGVYDSLLPWPLEKVVTMKLLDQSPDHANRVDYTIRFKTNPQSRSFQRPKTEMNIASGIPQFIIPISTLQFKKTGDTIDGQPWYIVDDKMFIEVTVQNALNRPPESELERANDKEDMGVDSVD